MTTATNSYQRVIEAFESNGLFVRETSTGKQAIAQTPGHSDSDRGTSITYNGDSTLVKMYNEDEGEKLELLAGLGLEKKDLFDNPRGSTYHYPGTRQVVRTPEKVFRQLGNTKETDLYRVEDLKPGVVYVVEGEKDVNTIRYQWGANAVTQAQGANTDPKKANWQPLAGRDVVVVADNDEPGLLRAEKVCKHISGLVASLTVVKAAEGKDASDHIAAGKTPEDFVEIEAEWALTPEQATRKRFIELVRSGDWLTKQEFPELQWAVPGIIPEGLNMLAAAPKIGKSWFASSLAVSCASGGIALGAVQVEKRPVLYFALEDGHRRLQDRLLHINHGLAIPKYLMTIINVTGLDELIIMAEYMQDYYRSMAPPLIIIDTLGRVMQSKSSGQSQYEADYQVGARLQNLAKRRPGCSVLVIHHTNKATHNDFLDSVSGTQGVAGAYDGVLVLNRDRKSKEGILAVTGRDIENETEYGLVSDQGRWKLIGGSLESSEAAVEQIRAEKQTSNFGDVKSRILAAVNALGEGDATSPGEVALKFGIDPKVASNNLTQLYNAGLIGKSGRGRYSPMKPMKVVKPVKAQVTQGEVIQFPFTPTSESSEKE